jgi:hypothetical protein
LTPFVSSCGTEQALSDEQRLWHLLKNDLDYLTYDHEFQRWRPAPTKQALNFDTDTNEMSTKWREHLSGHGWTAADVLDSSTAGYTLVFQAPVGHISTIIADGQPLVVRHTPTHPVPDGCAHTSVFWPASLSDANRGVAAKAKRVEVRMALGRELWRFYGEITLQPPP